MKKMGEYFLVYCNVLEYEKRHAVILKHIENFAHALDMNVFTFIKELNGIALLRAMHS